jgi:hypothetical protein
MNPGTGRPSDHTALRTSREPACYFVHGIECRPKLLGERELYPPQVAALSPPPPPPPSCVAAWHRTIMAASRALPCVRVRAHRPYAFSKKFTVIYFIVFIDYIYDHTSRAVSETTAPHRELFLELALVAVCPRSPIQPLSGQPKGPRLASAPTERGTTPDRARPQAQSRAAFGLNLVRPDFN